MVEAFIQIHCRITSILNMLLAILLPGLSMMVNGHFLKGLLCFFLQITVIGWIPAAIWGVASRSQDLAEQRHRETLEVLRHAER